ncbi:MAG: hypothetical protein QNJ11_11510 [Woeseiaceae bacterium]|nr:hypothetical protein [Woeseiaceae bacterium]
MTGLLDRFGLELCLESWETEIPGSFWGDSEAGVIGRKVFVREDTPVHSFLHETCHIICMDERRRAGLDRDAGGDDLEETAVCYLQVLLADFVEGAGRARLMQDMDAWGYSFRLGSTRAWFEGDAEDAREFLLNHGLIYEDDLPAFALRV